MANVERIRNAIANGDYILVAEFPKVDYVLIYRSTTDDWIAAYHYDSETKSWAQGHYFEKIEDAMRWIQNKIDVVPFLRLEEIASKAIDGLIEDDPYEAAVYFENELELTEDEIEYFGVTETMDMIKEQMEDDDYDF